MRTGSRHDGLLARRTFEDMPSAEGQRLAIFQNGITPQGQAVANDIVAVLRDHAMKRAPRTTEETAFSTRHVPMDSTR